VASSELAPLGECLEAFSPTRTTMGSRGLPTRRDPRAFLIGGTHEATPYCVWGVGGGGGQDPPLAL
jgi:hypothetical protein